MKASFIQKVIDTFPEATIIIAVPIEMDIPKLVGRNKVELKA